jgi:M6 family metalloprotease-like protein/MYXO-CTERM domain-containing protein
MTRRGLSILAMVLLGLSALPAGAVPAPPFPIQLQQPDGSSITGYLRGDEFLSWAEDMLGYSLVRDPADGFLRYAVLGRDGNLIPTVYLPGKDDPRRLPLLPGIRPTKDAIRRVVDYKRSLFPAAPGTKWSGDIPNLVILVKFANQSSHFTKAQFDSVMNGSSGSVKAYYGEISYNQWNIVSTVTDWINLSQNDQYYAYNSAYPYGHPEQMIREAVDYLNSQNFDFTRFDSNHDGVIDAVDVIHSGYGYEYSNNQAHIHSHFAYLSWTIGDITTHDGIRIVAYHTEPEYRSDMTNITQIGVIVHESGHFFGLPDLYDYDYDSGGVGLWCLMSAGPWAGPNMDGTVPTHLSAWGKYQLGMAQPTHIQATSTGRTLLPVESNSNMVLVNYQMPTNQYFIMENRQKTGFDAYLPGSGLLIYHVDQGQSDNNNQNRYLVDVEQADGRRDLNLDAYNVGDSSDPWPYSSNTTFGPSTTPNTKAYGASTSQITIANIQRSGSNINFDVVLGNATGSYLSLSPAQVSFTGIEGGGNPAPQSVQVTHQGTAALSWSAQSQAAWVTVSPTSGTTPGSANISVNLSGLAAGNYEGRVRFTAPSALNSPQDLVVRLQVNANPAVISVSPSRLDFSAPQGSNPAPQSVDVTNAGGGVLDWTIDAEGSWFNLSAFQGRAPSTVTVSPMSAGLAVGTYPGALVFRAPGASSVRVEMTLTVNTTAELSVEPRALSFATVVGGPVTPAQRLSVLNLGTGTMDWTAFCNPAWLLCSPASGSGNSVIDVRADPTGMPEGSYQGHILVTAPGAAGSPVEIPAQLQVSAQLPPGAPVPLSPIAGAEVGDTQPELTVQNATDPGGLALHYVFEVYLAGGANPIWTSDPVPEGSGGITSVLSGPLAPDGTYEWRAQARNSQGLSGPFCERAVFSVVASSGSGCSCGADGGVSLLFVAVVAGLGLRRRRRR